MMAFQMLRVDTWLIHMIMNLYCGSRGHVKVNCVERKEFVVNMNLYQRSALIPIFFIIVLVFPKKFCDWTA